VKHIATKNRKTKTGKAKRDCFIYDFFS
jgi:hypothetical protein